MAIWWFSGEIGEICNSHFRHIDLFYSYILWETLIGKYIFFFIWANNQLRTISQSRDIAFWLIQPYGLCISHFSHIGLFYTFILYETLIGKYIFCIIWNKNQLCTISESRDIALWLYFAQNGSNSARMLYLLIGWSHIDRCWLKWGTIYHFILVFHVI